MSDSNNDAALQSNRVLLKVVWDKISKDDVLLRASALAYSTLASLVPLFAITLAILSGAAFQEKRDGVLNALASALVPSEKNWVPTGSEHEQKLKQQSEVKALFEKTIRQLAENVGAVSVFGFLVLVATVGLLFQAIEQSFNIIWRAVSQRPFFMRVALATSMMFWGPVLLVVSISLTDYLEGLPFLGTYVVPTLFSTFAFTAFYMLMPHARVKFTSALIGGVAAALFWEIAKLLFLVYVTRVVSYNKVYGSLGLIPMLFVWVYVNWLIILYGAELAYCHQYRAAMVEQWLEIQREKKAKIEQVACVRVPPSVVLGTAIEAARHFQIKGSGGIRVSQIAQALHIEPGLAREAAEHLTGAGILARVAPLEDDSESAASDPAFLPASQPRACDVSALLAASYQEKQATGQGPALDRARQLLADVTASNNARFSTLTLADLADENEHQKAEGRRQ